MSNLLFPKVNAMLHGGDYNPEQWLDRPDILEEDIRLMKEAGVNTVTLGVFSWSVYEPVEGEYHFQWLHDIMDNLYENGIYTVLATPSGARPAWLDEKYPEAMRTTLKRIKNLHGQRHNHCITSPAYRKLVRRMDEHLAEEFGDHPGLILWHISNELGGECACDLCAEKFRGWLREKYHNDIEELNKAWWTTFWSHRFQDFSQIDPPAAHGESSIHGLNLDWKRFTTWNTRDFMESEIAVFREKTPEVPVTTNFMHLYSALDYNQLAKPLDIVSWDSYPRYGNPDVSLYDCSVENAFDHVTMRSFKKNQPFMMMESVPSLVNWHDYNKPKYPGVHRVTAMQTVACGSDTVQYFQWRKGRGSYEQFHGAVLDHLGRSDTRVFREVAEVGKMLASLKEVQGSLVKAKAAIIFDWDNRWSIKDAKAFSDKTKKYEETCVGLFGLFEKNGVEVDLISSEEDFSDYQMIAAPMLYLLKPGVADRLKAFVESGGQLMSTYITGYVDEHTLCFLGGFPGDGLTELFGLYTEEIDTLYPKEKNGAAFVEGSPVQGTYGIKDYCEVVKLLGAKTAAVYTDAFYKDTPVVTVNTYRKGKAWYVAARMEDAGMEALLRTMWQDAGIERKELPEGVEYHRRVQDEVQSAGNSLTAAAHEDGFAYAEAEKTSSDKKIAYDFYINYTDTEKTIATTPGTDLLTGAEIGKEAVLAPLGVIVCRVRL